MKAKEAAARIKINRLLDEAGWRFFDDENGPANIVLEPNTKITETQINAFGEDFQITKDGYIDFLLLDRDGKPLIVLEAKSDGKNPLAAKEQARRYANPRLLEKPCGTLEQTAIPGKVIVAGQQPDRSVQKRLEQVCANTD